MPYVVIVSRTADKHIVCVDGIFAGCDEAEAYVKRMTKRITQDGKQDKFQAKLHVITAPLDL